MAAVARRGPADRPAHPPGGGRRAGAGVHRAGGGDGRRLDRTGDTALAAWEIAKWPAGLVSAILALAILYRFAPNVTGRKIHWVSLGAVAALAIIGGATAGFGYFVSRFGNFNEVYGPLAGVIVFLLWLWLVNMAVVYGARLDAEVLRVRQLRAGIPAEEAVRVTPRDRSAYDAHSRRRARMLAAYRELRREDAGTEPVDTEPADAQK